MKNGKIRIALIGSGRAGMIHARNFRRNVGRAELVAVVDANEQVAQAAANELEIEKYHTDYRRVLNDDSVDAVIVVTPTKYHCGIVTDAAKAGKHVLCEKPMAMDENECEQMEKAAKAAKIKLQLAFMRRFDKSFAAAKRAIENGDIGDVVMVRSNTRGPSIPKAWMYDISKSNGPLAEVNSHDIDSLRWFAGSEIKSVYALGGNYRCADAKKDFPDFYDNVSMVCGFESGAQGIIDGAQGVLYGYDARCEILGTHGCIYLGNEKNNSVRVCSGDKRITEEYVTSWTELFKDAYLSEDEDFADCILSDRQPSVTGHDGKMAVKVVNAGNRSIKEGKVITL